MTREYEYKLETLVKLQPLPRKGLLSGSKLDLMDDNPPVLYDVPFLLKAGGDARKAVGRRKGVFRDAHFLVHLGKHRQTHVSYQSCSLIDWY